MNTISTITKVVVLAFVFITTVNVQCYKPEKAPLSLLILFLASEEKCKNDKQLKYEPNDDFAQATCLDESTKNSRESCGFELTTLYPNSDKDFFLSTLSSGSFRFYEYIEKFDSDIGFQFFDNNQSLIYDQNDTILNSKSSAIIENRLLTKDDCDSTRCDDFITKYRIIRFDPKIKQIYTKFYLRNTLIVEPGDVFLSLLSTTVDKVINPSRYGAPLLQGDIKPCK